MLLFLKAEEIGLVSKGKGQRSEPGEVPKEAGFRIAVDNETGESNCKEIFSK